ncbi:energy transducer TonB [Spongiibacter sp. KMU-158]|uniref:Energy transducer TonB n=1 Tax=Spongiibacter pelagi TaxID=2760804 RepID=A0A927GWR2_9GAMM|nr:energy transducer TonB [Spongiibacter pelagi]MBD2860026.1 energy transducer TonB [Spongiibacter pelagi]
MMRRWVWPLVVTMACSLHALAGWFLLADSAMPSGAAQGMGEQGFEIGLGLAGSYIDAQQSAEKVKNTEPSPVEEKPVEQKTVEKKLEEPTKPVKPAKALAQVKPVESSVAADFYQSPEKSDLETQEKPDSDIAGESVSEIQEAVSSNQRSSNQPLSSQSSVRATGSAAERFAGGKIGNAKDYFSVLMAWLNQHKRYPVDAKKQKLEGIVKLQFHIARDGSVSQMRVHGSSGHPALDAAAMQMLIAAAPMPPIPESMKREHLSLVIPVEYSLITNRSSME